MIAYKVFNSDWTCRGFKYQVGETYEEDINPSVCDRGFHFCKNLADCFSYYAFDPDNKVAEIEAIGDISDGGDKCCTNKIKIVREITWYEVLDMVNAGKGNTGLVNSGNYNSGYRNTGDQNSGDWNTGDRNSGDQNSGDRNTGDHNTGNRNTGGRNSGDLNTGNYNSGNWNTGGRNTGNWNTGGRNTGNWNTGDQNTGDQNTGDRNSGDYNTGDQNTGYWNSGDWNTGDWNTGSYNSGDRNTGDFNMSDNNAGCFNAEDRKLLFFDRETEITWHQWQNSRAYTLLQNIGCLPAKWIYADDMTEREKSEHPSYATTGGYLKKRDSNKAYQECWDRLSRAEKQCIREIPNFDSKKFEMITGINTED